MKTHLAAGFYLLSLVGFGIYFTPIAQAVPFQTWDQDFGGSDRDRLSVIVKTSDGGYLLGGSSKSGVNAVKSQPCKGGWDFWIVKISGKAGKKIWDKTYGGIADDNLTAILPTTDGGFLLGGSSNSGAGLDKTEASKGGSDFWVVKITADGVKQWDKTVGGTKDDSLTTLAYHRDQYVLGGRSNSPVGANKSEPNFSSLYPGSSDFWVVRMDATGNVVWDKTVGSDLTDDLDTIFVLLEADGTYNYVLAGTSDSPKNSYKSEDSIGKDGFGDYWIVKINSYDGKKIWDNTIGGTEDEYLWSAVQSQDGGFVLAGTSFSGVGGDNTSGHFGPVIQAKGDFWVAKVNSDGVKIWDKTYGGVDHDLNRCIVETKDQGFLIGGWSESGLTGNKTAANKGGYDYWIVRTDPSGNKLWDATYGGSKDDQMEALVTTDDYSNGYVLGGSSISPISGDKTQNIWGNNTKEDYWILQIFE